MEKRAVRLRHHRTHPEHPEAAPDCCSPQRIDAGSGRFFTLLRFICILGYDLYYMIYITWSILHGLYMIYIWSILYDIWMLVITRWYMHLWIFHDHRMHLRIVHSQWLRRNKKTVHPSVVRLLRQEMEDPPPHRGNPAAELSWALTIHQLLIVLYHQAFIIYTLW